MTDDLDDMPGISADTVLLLKAALSTTAGPRRSLEFDDFFRYAAGLLDDEEAYEVELALTRSSEQRNLAFQVHQRLSDIRSIPFASLISADVEDPLERQIRSAWHDFVSKSLATATPVRQWWAAETWTSALQKITTRSTEAHCAAGAIWWLGRRPPAAIAVAHARSSSDKPIEVAGISPAPRAAVNATVGGDGSLQLRLSFLSGLNTLRGRSITVFYGSGEFVLPILTTEVAGAEIQTDFPLFGALTGLHEGDLDGSEFSISVASEPRSTSAWRTQAKVVVPESDDGYPVEITEGPHTEGRLVIDVSVPTDATTRYPKGALQIDVLIGPGLRQSLGEWPLELWREGSHRLSIEFPGLQEPHRAFGCVLIAQIKA